MGAVKERYEEIVEEKIAWAARNMGCSKEALQREWEDGRRDSRGMISIEGFLVMKAKTGKKK